MTTGKALNGKPYAGNPHVRFDEGEVASAATPRRGSLLYKKLLMIVGMMFASVALANCEVYVPGDAGAVTTNSYNLSTLEAAEGCKSAQDFIDAYADNVRYDKNFQAHEKEALATIQAKNRFFGTWCSILPALLAIVLALITKEVYSSLFIGVLTGGLLYSGFTVEGTMMHVIKHGYIDCIADAYNIGIIMFFVLLGGLVSMMNRTGASMAFRHWAEKHVHSKSGAMVATVILGILIFVDDAFNSLTVGSVMRPVADAKKISRAKLAYLLDSTAAPICIIAPISSWGAAIAGFAKDAGAENGLALFISAIPYNFYALLTIVALFFIAITRFDFGPMKKYEEDVEAGKPDTSATTGDMPEVEVNTKGKVIDMVLPVIFLITACVLGLIYSGGYFGPDHPSFVDAFGNSDASVGLVVGVIPSVIFAILFYQARRVISFRSCMEAIPEGFRLMVPATLILCSAWALKSMTDSLGAKVFISDLINGPAASLKYFLPAIIFAISAALAFSTGTSWGTFGILIPIVLAALPGSPLTIVAVSACMAGAVSGDHSSPISDTTVVSSAGAQCDHLVHVKTQLPYVIVVSAVSFVTYLITPFVMSPWICLPIGIVLLLGTFMVMRRIMSRK